MASLLRIDLLGNFRVMHGDRLVTGIDNARLQSLLAYLVLHCDVPQSRAQLSYLFWLDSTESQARANLRKQVYHLRRALPDASRFLYTDHKVLQWQPDAPFTLDLADFENALDRAQEAERVGDQAGMQGALEQAVASYGGDLLPGCYDDWILTERERLRQEYARALETLIRLLEDQRAYEAAIQHAQQLLHHDPLHEVTHRQLMRLYALNGDRARALRTYHTCATVLQRELDVEPSTATQEAYERLLLLDASAPPPAERLASKVSLVGRDEQWAQLQRAFRSSSDGRPRLVMVTGEAGMGKTRLAEELIEWGQRQGIPTANARCYASEGGLAYGPVVAWLRSPALQKVLPILDMVWLGEIARLVPELLVEHPEIPPPRPMTEGWQRQHLFQALTQPFLAHRQLLLVLDDVQWCDQETLEWLPSLLHARFGRDLAGGQATQLLLVVTMRTEERTRGERLSVLLGDLWHSRQLSETELGPLDEVETFTLAANVAGRELDPALADPLYRGSEGNPLFVVEMVRAGGTTSIQQMVTHGQEMARVDLPLPPKVQRVIEARLAQLSPVARELAAVAATVGREFDFDVLTQAYGVGEDTLVRALDELWQRRIVREQDTGTYDFSHDRIREVAYAGLSAARRRLLHRRVAQALEAAYASDLEAVAGQVAAHYERAGQAAQAIPHYERAAKAAQRMYANEEAVAYFQRALGLLDLLPLQQTKQEAWRERTAGLQEGLGDVLHWIGQYDNAMAAYQRALGTVSRQDRIWQSRLHRKCGILGRLQHRFREGEAAFDLAETVLGEEPTRPLQEWWWEWVQIQLERMELLYFARELARLSLLVERVRPDVEQRAAPGQRVSFLGRLFTLYTERDRMVVSDEAHSYLETAFAASQELDDLGQTTYIEFGLGYSHLWRGELEQAEQHLQHALELAKQSGNVAYQMLCLTYLTCAQRMKAQMESTREYAQRSLAVAQQVGSPDYLGMAEANLSWVAWRDGDLAEAQARACAAMVHWQKPQRRYPFQWAALWPLIGLALARDDLCEAIERGRALLDPLQQRPPETLEGLLEEAVQAWDSGKAELARERLAQALDPASERGYL